METFLKTMVMETSPKASRDMGSGGGLGSTATSAIPPTQWPTSVAVVPIGCSLRCLRRDMGRDLVFEVCVMVPQGLPTPITRV